MKNGLKPMPRLIVAVLLGILAFLVVALIGLLVELFGMWLFDWTKGIVFGVFLLPATLAGVAAGARTHDNLPRYQDPNAPRAFAPGWIV